MTNRARHDDWLQRVRTEMRGTQNETEVPSTLTAQPDEHKSSRLVLTMPLGDGLMPPSMLMPAGFESPSTAYAS